MEQIQVRQTERFSRWLSKLRDREGRIRIFARLDRLADGNPGISRSLGAGVSELKIAFGPGYRVYYGKKSNTIILLLCGGDKSSQTTDIKLAKEMWSRMSKEP